MKLSLTPKTIPFELEDSNGVNLKLLLTELTAAERDDHLQELSARCETVDGKTQVTDFKALQASLLHRCIRVASSGAQISIETIQEWPARVVSTLYGEAQKLNMLSEEDTGKSKVEAAKNG